MELTGSEVDPRVRHGSRSPRQPGVSIIVLVTTDTSRLRACLRSVDACVTDRDAVELLVVANGTPDTELGWLRARDDIVLLTSGVNLGFGGGCNWAATVARAPRLLFLNDDTQVTPGWLEALGDAMDADPGIGVAASRVLLRSGALQEAGGVIWRDGTTSGVGRGLDPHSPQFAVRRDVDYASFCSCMVARAAWDAVGGFDEGYFPAYYEDTEFCLAAQQLGWRTVCEPASVVVHDEGASTAPRFALFLKTRNRARFAHRWRAFLESCEPPPRLLSGQGAVRRALDRASLRAARSRGIPGPERQPPGARGEEARGDVAGGMSGMEVDALQRWVAIDEEYIAHLSGEIAAAGPVSLARSRYLSARAAAGRVLIRHPRLGRLVRRLVVSVGNRG